jgi:hypothetical protein
MSRVNKTRSRVCHSRVLKLLVDNRHGHQQKSVAQAAQVYRSHQSEQACFFAHPKASCTQYWCPSQSRIQGPSFGKYPASLHQSCSFSLFIPKVPRKSILKAALNAPLDQDDPTIDPTVDYTTTIHDNPSKSFGSRRVSFAEHAHVRLFAKEKKQNTNSTASPDSPVQSGSPVVSDENAYPGSAAFNRRRSSLGRPSIGGSDMDIDENNTAPNLSAFVRRSSLPFEGDDTGDYGADDDMDMTTAIEQNILRRRSLSHSRQPLSLVSPNPAPEDTSISQASESSEAQQSSLSFSSSTDGDISQPMEYTVPMGKALRPPSAPSQEWLALRSVTHSGDTPYEAPASDEDSGEGMELTEALSRLSAKRVSLRLTDDENDVDMDETMDSTESSLGGMDEGDRTMNVSEFLAARASIEADGMEDMSGSWPGDLAQEDPVVRLQVQPSPASSAKPTTSHVPMEQLPKAMSTPKPSTIPRPFSFSFTPKPSTSAPSSNLKPGLSPSKPNGQLTPASDARTSPKKRSANIANEDRSEIRSSAAKSTNLSDEWPGSSTTGNEGTPRAANTSADGTPKPRRLSRSKKALWQSTGVETKDGEKPVSSLRKHLAQRKSLVGGLQVPAPPAETLLNKTLVGKSTGSQPSGIWTSYGTSSPMKAVDTSCSSPAMRVDPSFEVSVSARQSLSGAGEIGMDATAQWREGVENQSFIEEARVCFYCLVVLSIILTMFRTVSPQYLYPISSK